MSSLELLISALNKSKNIAIITHIRPDADALGSASAVKTVLEMQGKKADIFCDSEVAEMYDFIKHVPSVNKPTLSKYDTYISVDCGDETRLGKHAEDFKKCANSINIDHHITNTKYAKVNYIKNTSSTGELLYSIFNKMEAKLDKDIATALYAAISSDTGCFQHANTTANVHKVVAELMAFDINVAEINYYLFKRKSMEQMQLQKIALKNLLFFEDSKIAAIYLRDKDYKACNIKNKENNGLVDICINIENVDIGICIREIKPNLFTCSLRSKDDKVDVAKIAHVFGGGGHVLAAGCSIFGSAKTVLAKLVTACKPVLESL